MKKLYIVHGWTYDLSKWTELVGKLSTSGFEAVQLKVPGLTTKSDKVYTIDDYVECKKL